MSIDDDDLDCEAKSVLVALEQIEAARLAWADAVARNISFLVSAFQRGANMDDSQCDWIKELLVHGRIAVINLRKAELRRLLDEFRQSQNKGNVATESAENASF